MNNMEKAVKELQQLMDGGAEYCPTVEAIAEKYQVDEMELEEAWFKSCP